MTYGASYCNKRRSDTIITLTNQAASKVDALRRQEMGENPLLALRVAVRSGGCSGFSYEMFFDTATSDDWSGSCNGVPLLIDPQSAPYLTGATLDYQEGLMGAGFRWDNPNVSRSCGCGQSWS